MKQLTVYNYEELSPAARSLAFESLIRRLVRKGFNATVEADREQVLKLLEDEGSYISFCENGNLVEVDGELLWYNDLKPSV